MTEHPRKIKGFFAFDLGYNVSKLQEILMLVCVGYIFFRGSFTFLWYLFIPLHDPKDIQFWVAFETGVMSLLFLLFLHSGSLFRGKRVVQQEKKGEEELMQDRLTKGYFSYNIFFLLRNCNNQIFSRHAKVTCKSRCGCLASLHFKLMKQ